MNKTVRQTAAFTARNIKLFFKDKGSFIGALIAPLILFMLYVLFLHSVLKDAFAMNLPDGFTLSDRLIDGYTAAYEVASIISVSCITVAFVANMCMVSDRVTGARTDLTVAPVKTRALVLGYYFATAAVTLIVCLVALVIGLIYIAAMGWCITVADGFLILLDVVLGVLFGTAMSSIVCFFLKSNGAISAVSTIVSSVYGFISGAYYPIAQFSSGMSNFVMCLPWTYCTGLFRTHFMSGYGPAFVEAGVPSDAAEGMLKGLDAKLFFFDNAVPAWAMYVVVICSIVALVGIFVAINVVRRKHKNKIQNPSANVAAAE
ncbi:MAG: ABC transporter permease [Clostridiales bacterium]|nr:ABC transporter permease [Clostridiales bacterium]